MQLHDRAFDFRCNSDKVRKNPGIIRPRMHVRLPERKRADCHGSNNDTRPDRTSPAIGTFRRSLKCSCHDRSTEEKQPKQASKKNGETWVNQDRRAKNVIGSESQEQTPRKHRRQYPDKYANNPDWKKRTQDVHSRRMSATAAAKGNRGDHDKSVLRSHGCLLAVPGATESPVANASCAKPVSTSAWDCACAVLACA